MLKWTYGKNTGQMPVKNGTLTVLDSGRIEGFTVEADVSSLTVTAGESKETVLGESILNGKKFPTAKMVASTVLPNTVDEAFTVAFSLDAAGKNTSLATGMFVAHEGEGIKVMGDITIDPKSVGFANATETLTISPVYVFK
jgi:polyisoprenoid-binding protein YceI